MQVFAYQGSYISLACNKKFCCSEGQLSAQKGLLMRLHKSGQQHWHVTLTWMACLHHQYTGTSSSSLLSSVFVAGANITFPRGLIYVILLLTSSQLKKTPPGSVSVCRGEVLTLKPWDCQVKSQILWRREEVPLGYFQTRGHTSEIPPAARWTGTYCS